MLLKSLTEKEEEKKEKRSTLNYERLILDSYQVAHYDETLIDMLLQLLLTDPPFRLITFKILTKLICNFTYNKKLTNCLQREHFALLQEGYLLSIKNLKRLFK